MTAGSWFRDAESAVLVASPSLSLVPEVSTLSLAEVAKPGVASLPIRPPKLKTRSFYFPQAGAWREKLIAAAKSQATPAAPLSPCGRGAGGE